MIEFKTLSMFRLIIRGVSELRIRIRADIRMNFDIRIRADIRMYFDIRIRADIRMNFDILIRICNISCGCHADIANNKRIIFDIVKSNIYNNTLF